MTLCDTTDSHAARSRDEEAALCGGNAQGEGEAPMTRRAKEGRARGTAKCKLREDELGEVARKERVEIRVALARKPDELYFLLAPRKFYPGDLQSDIC